MGTQSLWSDPDRRRAILLSITLHLLLVLGLGIWITIPKETPVERLIVVEVGVPDQAAPQVDVPQADSLPEKPSSPQVVVSEVPILETRIISELEPTTANSESAFNPSVRGVPVGGGRETTDSLIEEEVVTSTRGDTSDSLTFMDGSRQLEPLPFDLPRDSISTTTLPEIESEELAEMVSIELINIPIPVLMEQVPKSQVIAISPTLVLLNEKVLTDQEVLTPELKVVTSNPIEVPIPQVGTFVTPEEIIASSSPTVELPGVRNVPLPELTSIILDQLSIPQPEVNTGTFSKIVVPSPEVTPVITETIAVGNPNIQLDVSIKKNIPEPYFNVYVQSNRDVNIVPHVDGYPQLTEISGIEVNGKLPETKMPLGEKQIDHQVGETDSSQSVQVTLGPDAAPDDPGAVASSDFMDAADRSSKMLSGNNSAEVHKRPLIALLDNVGGYPQSGLVEAGQVVEIPVEGGLTRLMAIYETVEPYKVGPIRSARDYFLNLATSMSGILIHAGGSPDVLMAIAKGDSGIRTINAQDRGDLFVRERGREAPYNLYSFGRELRTAIEELELEAFQVINVSKYLPADDTPIANGIEILFSSDYTSAFDYLKSENQYRWLRNGQKAVDSTGEPVVVEAVLVGEITATRRSGDLEGRLDIPLNYTRYRASLFLRGVKILGYWYKQDGIGIQFVAANGELIDLRSLKTWVVLTPTYSELIVR